MITIRKKGVDDLASFLTTISNGDFTTTLALLIIAKNPMIKVKEINSYIRIAPVTMYKKVRYLYENHIICAVNIRNGIGKDSCCYINNNEIKSFLANIMEWYDAK